MAKHTKRSSKRSHRNKKHGGGKNNAAPVVNNAAADPVEVPVVNSAAAAPAAPVVNNAAAAPAGEGGRRKTRKASKGISDWNKKVMMVYHEMKKKDSSVKLGAAMKECSKRKKRGEL